MLTPAKGSTTPEGPLGTASQFPQDRASPAGPRPLRFARPSPPTGWILVVVLIFLLSGLPTAANSVAAAPRSPARLSLQEQPISSPSNPTASSIAPSTEAIAASGGYDATQCLLGVFQECESPRAPVLDPVSPTPLAPPPSSWTQITPPTGSPNPTVRELPAESYYPTGHEVIVFGGYGPPTAGMADTYLQDTWAFSGGHWTELISGASCTATSCPPGRAGAMLAYDASQNALVLFGGYIFVPGDPFGFTILFGDTWLFSNNTWTNVTGETGTSPSPRYSGVLTYDPSDNYDVLFGGEGILGASLGDTWKFSVGTWTNLTSGLSSYPEARSGAAIAASPDGHVVIYGGEYNGTIITNPCAPPTGGKGFDAIAAWFYEGAWTPMLGYPNDCPPPGPANASSAAPIPAGSSPEQYPPCGRVDASLGWSPKNNRFVLYGGLGFALTGDGCAASESYLNDTWTYDLPSGGGFAWNNATYPSTPPARAYMGYASDFTDDYFEIFGGSTSSSALLNASWRFYEQVYARISGPLGINTQPGTIQLTNIPFSIEGYGGSGTLDYRLDAFGLRNTNTMSGSAGCDALSADKNIGLGFNGTWNFACSPNPKAFNVYRIVLTITDEGNSSHPTTTANWTFTISPPEKIAIQSEYIDDFYRTVDFTNIFGLFAEVDYGPATSVSASIGGSTVHFVQQSFNHKWWNASVPMSSVPVGAILHVEAQFDSNWTLNASLSVNMIAFPGWLQSVFDFSGASQSVHSSGHGPYNKTFTVLETYDWDLSESTSFSLPIELLGGGYNVVPSMTVVFTLTSMGDLSIAATIPLTAPSIDIGPASIQFYVNVSLSGTFDVAGTSVEWISASATLSVAADVSASVPIYGFSILGISIGFYLDVSISASFALTLVLAPVQPGGSDIFPGIAIEVEKLLGVFTLALSASVDFGIGIASIGLGAGISVALAMTLSPSFSIGAGWVNGSIFVTASFLFWSDSWNIVSGTIYSWDPPPSAVSTRPDDYQAPIDNGSSNPWVLENRYYNVSGYDRNVWNVSGSDGPAISDIYPYTEITAAAASNGAYLFYTNDNTSESVEHGIGISGARLNSTSNSLGTLPMPSDPGYLIVSPQATTLPDGNVFLVWSALPIAEASLGSPLDLTSLSLQGAQYSPGNGTWGPIETFSSSEYAQSYRVDATGHAPVLLELLASSPLLGDNTSEHLVEYNLTTQAVVSNESASGWSEVLSMRAASGLAVLETLGGNYSLVNIATGASVTIGVTPPSGDHLVSANFVEDSPSSLLLLYRGPTTTDLLVYDTADQQTLGNVTLSADASEAEGIASGATDYVFVRTAQGILGWAQTGATFTNYTSVEGSGIESYGLVQAASSIVIYDLAPSGGNSTNPIVTLTIAELGGVALPAVPSTSGSGTTGTPPAHTTTSPPDYALYLEIGAIVVILLLAVVAVATRRTGPPPTHASGGRGASGPASPSSGNPSAATPSSTSSPPPPSVTGPPRT